MSNFTYITEDQVKGLLTWSDVFEAVDMSFRSVCKDVPEGGNKPVSSQPPRSFTWGPNKSGVLLTMPCFVGNYNLPSTTGNKDLSTLACKLVTSFEGNESRTPPLPTIMATIMLMSPETGKLSAIVEGTEITKARTAAASLVATKYLYFNRPLVMDIPEERRILAIIGCGVQGEIHAIGFASLYGQIKEIRLFNRTVPKRDALYEKLNSLRNTFKNPEIIIRKCDTATNCVQNADIIVTATNSSIPLIKKDDLKSNVHINAVGAGRNHHTELHPGIYENCKLYPDNWESSRTELAEIFDKITGIVGDVIMGVKPQPTEGITVFQSMGMAVEDATVAQMVLEKHNQGLLPRSS